MAALLRGGCRSLEGHFRSYGLRSELCLRTINYSIVSLSPFTSNVHPNHIRDQPSETSQNITLKDGSLFVSSNAAKHWCHPKHFHTREPALVTSSNMLETKTCGPVSFGVVLQAESIYSNSLLQQRKLGSGLEQRGMKNPSWRGWRSYSSLQGYDSDSFDISSVTELTEAETDSFSAENVEDFDFRNFPVLTSSFFENYERPNGMQVRNKKRATWQCKAKLFNADKKLTVDSIPKPRGRIYDFGLGDIAAKPPPLEAGARPQGGFDIDISFDKCEVDACESSPSMLQRNSCLDSLPLKSLEAGECSKISKDCESRDSQMTEDGILDYEEEFFWDPYSVDEHSLSLCELSEFPR